MKNKQKIFVFVFLTLCFCVGLFFFVNMFSKKSSAININGESLIALNKQSQKYKIDSHSKDKSLKYKFTENQKNLLLSNAKKNDGGAVRITVEVFDKKDYKETSLFTFGFLYKDANSNDLILSSKSVKCNLSKEDLNNGFRTFSLSLCIEPNSNVPDGFFVTGQEQYELKHILFTESVVGFDKSITPPLFAFCASGGECKPFSSSFDFSFAASQFSNPPKLVVTLKKLDDVGTYQNQTKVKFLYGNDLVCVRRTKNQCVTTVQTAALHTPYSTFVPKENAEQILSVLLKQNPSEQRLANGAVVTPYLTDLGLIMSWQKKNWRYNDYELYSWESFPNVLFFDFANYKVQNQYFTRLAYFVEKTGYKGTLVSDYFVENKHGYNAHDYKAQDLANFFTLAKKQNFQLNQKEIDLCGILQANKIISYNKESQVFEAGEGAIVSFTRESPDYLRWQFLAHECWHGIFFTDSLFRNKVMQVYNNFDTQSLEFIKTYWSSYPSLGYDRNDEYLMQNEFMGYLMQQNLKSVRDYFLEKASWDTINKNRPELTKYVKQNQAQHFVDAAEELNNYAFDNYGLAAGRVSLVSLE